MIKSALFRWKTTTRPFLSSDDSQSSTSRTVARSLVFSVYRLTVDREVQTSQSTRWQEVGEEEVEQLEEEVEGVEGEEVEEVEEAGKNEVVTNPGAALGKSVLEMN